MICPATMLSSGVTAVILTHNRPEECAQRVRNTAEALRDGTGRIFAVNNGTASIPIPPSIGAIPCQVLDMKRNQGASARNSVLEHEDTPFLLMLDDDCDVSGAIVQAMIRTFHEHPDAGAVSFRIYNGATEEACLLPTVFHGCAVGFRTEALRRIGGYPAWILYYGEEYDVSFRLYSAGYRIARVNNHGGVKHMRHPQGRKPDRILRLLVTNNVRVLAQSFPRQTVSTAIMDVLRRYEAVARKEGVMPGFWSGVARIPLALLAARRHPARMPMPVFRQVALLDQLEDACGRMRQEGVRRVVVCETGKFPSLWFQTLQAHDLEVAAFADMNTCWRGGSLLGRPVHVVNPNDPAELQPLLARFQTAAYLIGTGAVPESDAWRRNLSSVGLRDLAGEEPAAPEAIILPDEHVFSAMVR